MASKSTRRRQRFNCVDCAVDTGELKEFYFVNTELWLAIMPTISGMLCIGCLERRLGRTLCNSDFTEASINRPQRGTGQSARLRDRLTALHSTPVTTIAHL